MHEHQVHSALPHPFLNFLAIYQHQIDLAIILAALTWHVWRYRKEMF